MINREKRALRAEYKALRNSVADMEAKSDSIYELLIDSHLYYDAETVLLYWSVDSEVATHKMIDKIFSDGKKLALPKCVDANGNMLFYFVRSYDDIVDGMYGIKEPVENELYIATDACTLCLVPGLCYTLDGYRLGYGKGYYDRFLENFSGVSVGLCYDECLVESLPVDGYDKKVDFIITDKRIYNIK